MCLVKFIVCNKWKFFVAIDRQKKCRRLKHKVRLNLREIDYLFREIHKIRLAYNVFGRI